MSDKGMLEKAIDAFNKDNPKRKLENKVILQKAMMPNFKQLLKGTGITYAVNEKAPGFLYTALKDGEEVLFAKKDRKKWKVVMNYDWFVKNMLSDKIKDESTL